MLKTYINTLFTILVITLVSCTNKGSSTIVFNDELVTYKDTTNTWLHTVSNFKKDKDNYLKVLNNFYDQKIREKDYLSAAEALDVCCLYLSDRYDFNEQFVAKIRAFDSKYRKNVPTLKTTFVDSYLANYYFDTSDLKKASVYFKKITALKPNDYASCYNIARAYYDLSYVYYIMGKQNLSLIANQKSFEYFTKINNSKGLAFVYSNYANIYTAIGDKKRAIENADNAINAYKSIDNTYNVYIALINKISLYEFLGDSREEALIDSVYHAFVTSKDNSDILKIKIFDFKIENLVKKNQLSDAKILIDILKPIVEKVDSEDLALEYKVINSLYEIQKDSNYSNLDAIEKALPTFKANQQYEKVTMFYELLQNKAIQNNDFKKALQYEEAKKVITDSIGNIAARIRIAELETLYESDKKAQQIVLQDRAISYKNTTIALLISSLVALLFISIAYILRQQQKKLKQEKENVQQFTKQLLENTEDERKRIASDLHDSVSHELLSLKNSLEDKTDQTNKKIDSIINDIRAISRNLHPVMFDKIGLEESINQMVERIQVVNHFMVSTEIDYPASLTASHELQIYRIVQEALSNIIKYSNAIAAKITLIELKNSFFLEIKDNGKGFDVEQTLHNSTSFGLHNIIERSKAINGLAKIISSKNGTIITVTIKKHA